MQKMQFADVTLLHQSWVRENLMSPLASSRAARIGAQPEGRQELVDKLALSMWLSERDKGIFTEQLGGPNTATMRWLFTLAVPVPSIQVKQSIPFVSRNFDCHPTSFETGIPFLLDSIPSLGQKNTQFHHEVNLGYCFGAAAGH